MMPTPHKYTEAETQLGGALPHRRDEAWKWTDVRAAVKPSSGLTLACVPEIMVADGLSVERADRDAKQHAMGALATSFAGEAYIIDVPAGFTATEPVRISSLIEGHARIFIKLGKAAKLTVWERHESDKAGFANIEMSFDLAEGAELTRAIFHADHEDTTRLANTHINAWRDAKITQHTLSFGAALSRFETGLASMGENLNAVINGAYLLAGKRHADMTSIIDLTATDGMVRQSVKGVATEKSRGVFQGKFHVRRPAQQTDAEMRHDALMLSDTCEIRAKPELEIYADDVACAHGNTIGALDESALFYMRQRGIPIAQARALLTEAFVAEAFDDLDDSLTDEYMGAIRSWLETHS